MRILLLITLISCAPKHIETENPSQFSDYPEIDIELEDLEDLPEAGNEESEEEIEEEER